MLLLQAAIWAGMFTIFLQSPVPQMNDSQYSMLTAESIIRNHTPDLSSYAIKHYQADLPFDSLADGKHAYQLARTNGRLLYGFGHGTSILSIPFVAMMDLVGISPATADGKYNLAGEVIIEKMLAALLMASLVIVFFRLASLRLNWQWSAIVALGAGLGTSVWSTASRGMWAHTWEIMLGGVVVYLLLAAARGGSVRPVLLATLVSWMFFVRPIGAVPAVTVGIYILFYRPREAIPYAIAGALWLGAFVAYSMRIFGTSVPYYYLSDDPRGIGVHFMQGLYGTLFSPSRGIFVLAGGWRRRISHHPILASDRRSRPGHRCDCHDRCDHHCQRRACGMVGRKLVWPTPSERFNTVVCPSGDSRGRRDAIRASQYSHSDHRRRGVTPGHQRRYQRPRCVLVRDARVEPEGPVPFFDAGLVAAAIPRRWIDER